MRPTIRGLALVAAVWTIAAPDIAAGQRPPRPTAIVNVNVLPMAGRGSAANQIVRLAVPNVTVARPARRASASSLQYASQD